MSKIFKILKPGGSNEISDCIRKRRRNLDEAESLPLGMQQPFVEVVERSPLQLQLVLREEFSLLEQGVQGAADMVDQVGLQVGDSYHRIKQPGQG